MHHLPYIKQFFATVPDTLLPVRCGIIKLGRQGIDCHIATCKANKDNPYFEPYYERLVEAGRRVKEKIIQK